MADDLARATGDLLPRAGDLPTADEPLVEPRRRRRLGRRLKRRRPHALRFGAAYAALAVVLGVAAAGFVVLVGRPGVEAGPQWSTWKPEADGTEGARQIADHVSQRYRLPSGKRLVGVLAGPPSVQNIPVKNFALAKGTGGDDYSIISADDSIAYVLCGLGQRCSITEGEPSLERGRLLHRQALELALYSFEYIDDIDSVVAFLPPAPGASPTLALFFRRGDLAEDLKRPLHMTLPGGRLTPKQIDKEESRRIERMTDGNLFRYHFQQAPDGSAVLVFSQQL